MWMSARRVVAFAFFAFFSTLSAAQLLPPMLSWSTNAITFAPQPAGQMSAPHRVVLTNNAAGPVSVPSVSANNPQFLVAHDCAPSVPQGGSCTVRVYFHPVLGAAMAPINAELIVGDPIEPLGAYWSGEVDRMAELGAARSEVWLALAKQFFNAQEYRSRLQNGDSFIVHLYAAFMNRAPSGEEIEYWRAYSLSAPMPGALLLAFGFSAGFAAVLGADATSAAPRPEVDLLMDLYRGAPV